MQKSIAIIVALSVIYINSRMSFFPFKNHCKCYKKLVSRLWPVLFTLTWFFLIHAPFSSAGKKVAAIAVFIIKLDH